VTKLDAAVPSRRSLPRDALALAVAMAVANATNYGFSLVMAFLLGPAAYGALGALLALVLVGSVPGLALQAVVARRTALLGRTAGQAGEVPWHGMPAMVNRAGVALAGVTVLVGPGLVAFLHLDSAVPVMWLALALAPTPLLFAGFGGLLAGGLAAAVGLGLDVPVLGRGYAGLGPLLPLFAALGTGQALVQLLLFEGIATRDRRMGRAVAAALAAEAALVAGVMHGSVAQVVLAALAVVSVLAGTGWWLLHRRLAAREPVVVAAP